MARNTPQTNDRTTRLTALVSETEAARINALAEAAGLSVSAFLRERALDERADQFDALLGRMEADLDAANDCIADTLARMEAHG